MRRRLCTCLVGPLREIIMNDSLMAVSASSSVPHFRDGRLRGDRQRGVSMVELVVAVPALLLVGMAVVQMVLVFHARQSVGYALQEAARAGAVEHAGEEAILKGLASGLVPWLYGAGSMAEKMLKEQQARLHVTGGRAAQWIEVKQLSPTLESFSDWAGPARDPFGEKIVGQDEIPNDNLDNRREKTMPANGASGYRGSEPIGRSSGQTLADANMLRLEVTYGVPLRVPGVSTLFLKAMRTIHGCDSLTGLVAQGTAGSGNCLYYLQGRIPVKVVTTTRMMSPARRSPLLMAAVKSNVPMGQGSTLGAGTLRPVPQRTPVQSNTGPAPQRHDPSYFMPEKGPVRWGLGQGQASAGAVPNLSSGGTVGQGTGTTTGGSLLGLVDPKPLMSTPPDASAPAVHPAVCTTADGEDKGETAG